jgi:hypothetical protein
MRLVGALSTVAEINRVCRAAIYITHKQLHDIDAEIF